MTKCVSRVKKYSFWIILGFVILSLGFGNFTQAQNQKNYVVTEGVKDKSNLKKKFYYGDHQGHQDIGNIYSDFKITPDQMQASQKGFVTKEGKVLYGENVIADQAVVYGRNDSKGAVKKGSVFGISAKDAFSSQTQEAFVYAPNGNFKWAVLKSCGNVVEAKATIAAKKKVEKTTTKKKPEDEKPKPEEKPKKGTLVINKCFDQDHNGVGDADHGDLSGFAFKITSKQTKAVITKTTSSEGKIQIDLDPGIYIVHEEVNKNKFILLDQNDLPVKILGDGAKQDIAFRNQLLLPRETAPKQTTPQIQEAKNVAKPKETCPPAKTASKNQTVSSTSSQTQMIPKTNVTINKASAPSPTTTTSTTKNEPSTTTIAKETIPTSTKENVITTPTQTTTTTTNESSPTTQKATVQIQSLARSGNNLFIALTVAIFLIIAMLYLKSRKELLNSLLK